MNLSPRPFVVMCTTENGMTKIQEALQCGADEYIMKPYDQEVLKDKLEQLEAEVQRVRASRTALAVLADDLLQIPKQKMALEELRRQLQEWQRPLESGPGS